MTPSYGDRKIYDDEQKVKKNHKVVRVEFLSEKEDVYDLKIEKNHNFPTEAGVFVHNCAYGDLFLDLNGMPKTGILSIDSSKSPIEFYRIEHNGQLIGFYHQAYSGQTKDQTGLLPPYRFTHIMLTGARRRRPVYGDNYGYRTSIIGVGGNTFQESTHYGTPILMPALPVYKRLRLCEDCILMGRATKTPLKYGYFIGIPNDGCFRGDTKIKLLDGTTPTIKEMADNKNYYIGRSILTVDPDTQKLHVGKILDAKPTRKNAELVRIWLDNGTYADSTPDHRYMLRTGVFKEAKDLIEGESLMPLYTKLSKKVLKQYELVYNPGENKWSYTHRLVGKHINNGEAIPKGYVVHHKDFTPLNNDESNLQIMTNKDHYDLHVKLGHLNCNNQKGISKTEEHKEKIRKSHETRAILNKYKVICSCGCGEEILCNPSDVRIYKNQEHYLNDKIIERETRVCACGCGETFIIAKTSKIKYLNLQHAYKVRNLPLETRECKCGCGFKKEVKINDVWKYKRGHQPKDNWIRAAAESHRGKPSWNSTKILNHKVVKVEFLLEREDTYDLTIDGFSNFPLANGVFVHNSNIEAVAEIIKSYSNILKRARSLDTTPGNQTYNDRLNNMTAVDDLIAPVWGDVNQIRVEKFGGEVDIKWLCLRGDTKIKLLDGTSPTIKQIADNKEQYIGKYIYACNKEGQVVARPINDAAMTRPKTNFVRVTLDNGKSVDVTPDHPFMLRNGIFEEAQYLKPGQSLMPLYTKIRTTKLANGYEELYNPKTGKYELTHQIVAKSVLSLKNQKEAKSKELIDTGKEKFLVIHHRGIENQNNKLNNDPSNLQWMGFDEHQDYHHNLKSWNIEQNFICKHCNETLGKIKLSDYMNHLQWNCSKTERPKKRVLTEKRKIGISKISTNSKWIFNPETKEEKFVLNNNVSSFLITGWILGRNKELENSTIEKMKVKNRNSRWVWNELLGEERFINKDTTEEFLSNGWKFGRIPGRKRQGLYQNHKVISVEMLDIIEDAYDLQIEGNYDKNGGPEHCFALDCGVFVHNTDLDKLEKQVATALCVPLPILSGYAGEAGSGFDNGGSLEKMDIRFGRNVRRVQRALIQGVTRICQIHLGYLGLDPDPKLFQVHMSETSNAEELEKVEVLEKTNTVVSSLIDTLAKIVGDDKLNREAVYDMVNEQYYRFQDLNYEDLLLPPEKVNTPVAPEQGVGAPPVVPPPGAEPIQGEETINASRIAKRTARLNENKELFQTK